MKTEHIIFLGALADTLIVIGLMIFTYNIYATIQDSKRRKRIRYLETRETEKVIEWVESLIRQNANKFSE